MQSSVRCCACNHTNVFAENFLSFPLNVKVSYERGAFCRSLYKRYHQRNFDGLFWTDTVNYSYCFDLLLSATGLVGLPSRQLVNCNKSEFMYLQYVHDERQVIYRLAPPLTSNAVLTQCLQ